TDALADPPGEADALHIERLVRLPESAWCYEPPDDAPDVAPPPCAAAGHITFGSFNNFAKVNESLIALWSKVLLAVDGSRLLLKAASLRDPATRTRAHDAFAAHGVAAERVELIGMTATPREHLDLYWRVDVALDTFPYHGTTTTCEALWMGVPVVTLAGRTHASRVGVSLLTSIGLTDLIAADEEGYIAAAARLADDRTTLAQIRATLRARMRRSPLMAGVRFTRAWESALRAMTGA
ncbi:MAG: protein O-GlcNAc transferase, partial [Humisphaera sp.]|nr:protein O-GlcNAc transferase [Humisphaera sp.]